MQAGGQATVEVDSCKNRTCPLGKINSPDDDSSDIETPPSCTNATDDSDEFISVEDSDGKFENLIEINSTYLRTLKKLFL